MLADEVTRRETSSAVLRAKTAGLDPTMCLENWDDTAEVSFDRQTWSEFRSLRSVEGAHNVVIMGPGGVGKTFLATALGHAAVRRRYSVHSSAATACCGACAPAASTTATTPRCASCCASTS